MLKTYPLLFLPNTKYFYPDIVKHEITLALFELTQIDVLMKDI